MLTEDKKGKAITFDYRPKTLQENNQKYSMENMMPENEKFNIIYVCSKLPKFEAAKICSMLCDDLPIEQISRVEHIQEIFPLLSSSSFKVDFISIDVDDLSNGVEGSSMFDIIRTLSTLIKCTVYRERADKKPIKRATKIVAMLSENISPSLLNEILSMPEIDYLSIRVGPNVGYEFTRQAVENYLNYGERAPKFITDLFKKKKEVKQDKSEIILTPRQNQINDIVSSRGASNKVIAKMLGISESTVKLHIGAILKKHGLKNRTQLAVFSKRSVSQTEVYIP